MRTKKVRKSRQTFRSVGNPSEMPSVMVQTGHVSDMRGPSVMPSVCDVGNAVGNRADGHVSDMRADNSVGDAVGIGIGNSVGNPSVNVAKSRNFFSTLCEIPTGYSPSVYPSVNVAKSRNCFATLCEIPTGYNPSVYTSVKR
jgi:hypothetical protein